MNNGLTFSYNEALLYLGKKEWGSIDFADKVGVLQAVENEMATRQGREPSMVKSEEFELLEAGHYNPYTNEIYINSNLLNHSKYGIEAEEHLDTVLHEGRHAYQTQVVAGKISHHNQGEAATWENNLSDGNYISARENYPRYYNQPVEKDARSFSLDMQRQIHKERELLINRENKMDESKNVFKTQMDKSGERLSSHPSSKEMFVQQRQGKSIDCDISNNEVAKMRLKDKGKKR